MMRRGFWRILILTFLILVGCSSAPLVSETPIVSTPTRAPEPTATVKVEPDAGKSTVVGQVLSISTDKPLPYQFVRLAEVIRQEGKGLYVLDIGFSPVGTSDVNGNFFVPNIPPGEYVIIVGDVATSLQRVDNADGNPVVFTALPDQVLNVGKIKVLNP